MKNWKTTLGGILLAVGAGLQGTQDGGVIGAIGTITIALGGLLMGYHAKDKENKS